MEFCGFLGLMSFVVRFLDRFLGLDVWQWRRRSKGSHVFSPKDGGLLV